MCLKEEKTIMFAAHSSLLKTSAQVVFIICTCIS